VHDERLPDVARRANVRAKDFLLPFALARTSIQTALTDRDRVARCLGDARDQVPRDLVVVELRHDLRMHADRATNATVCLPRRELEERCPRMRSNRRNEHPYNTCGHSASDHGIAIVIERVRVEVAVGVDHMTSVA
jgi:hypothetical protein